MYFIKENSRKRCAINFISENELYWLFVVYRYTDEDLSDQYNCSVSTVRRVRQRYGITRQSRKEFMRDGMHKAVRMMPPTATSKVNRLFHFCKQYLKRFGNNGEYSEMCMEMCKVLRNR